MSTTQPVRYPDTGSRPLMTRRAWWLVALNVLVPGSAQVLAGDRRLGRFGIGTTLVLWLLVVAAVIVSVAAPTVLVTVATTPLALAAVVVVLAFYAVVWVILTFDTLRLVRLVKVAPSARGALTGLAMLVLVALVGGSAFVGVRAVSAIGVLDTVFGGGADLADPIEGRYNILLLGGDAGADRTGLRPDSISVLSIEAATGETTIFGVPRNLENVPFSEGSPMWGLYPDGYDCGVDCLISYLYTETENDTPELYPDATSQGSSPGIEATRDAVEGVLGLQIQYYVLIDMKGFEKLIDALGGIEVDVKQRLPIEGGQDADGNPTGVKEWIEEGEQRLDGYHALWYARSRHSTDDYDRMSRQRVVQQAVLDQMDPANVLLRFNEVAGASRTIVKTDIPQGMLAHFTDLALKAKELPIETLDIVPPAFDPDEPDYERIRAEVAALMVLSTPSPAPGD